MTKRAVPFVYVEIQFQFNHKFLNVDVVCPHEGMNSICHTLISLKWVLCLKSHRWSLKIASYKIAIQLC